MSFDIKAERNLLVGPGTKPYKFITDDGQEFFDMKDAIAHAEAVTNPGKPPVVYEQIWSIQEAINMAVAENRVVRFLWYKSNESIRKDIVDLKGCKIMKKSKELNDVAVVPPGFEDFDFDDVK